MEGKAHMAIAGAIRWVAAQPSFACAAHSDLLLILLMSFTGFVAAGLPDVFDSGRGQARPGGAVVARYQERRQARQVALRWSPAFAARVGG